MCVLNLSDYFLQFLVESIHSRHMTALRSTPDQTSEALREEAAHQREVALDVLFHVAQVFDFPDLNRFLNVCPHLFFS